MRNRWMAIGGNHRAVRGVAVLHAARAEPVLPVVRPPGNARRPDPAAKRLDHATRRGGRHGSRRRSRTIPDIGTGAPTSAKARSASTCRSTSSCENPYFAQVVIVSKDARGARRRGGSGCENGAAQGLRRHRQPASAPLEMGPPVGLADPVPGQRQGHRLRCASIAHRAGQRTRQRTRTRRTINYDWNEPGKVLRIDIDQDKARQLGIARRRRQPDERIAVGLAR